MRVYVLVSFIILMFCTCKVLNNDKEKQELSLKLELITDIDTVKNKKYTTFKYYITNTTGNFVYFNTLTFSDYVVDERGQDVPAAFFRLKIIKLKEDNAKNPCEDPHDVVYPMPRFTLKDTLKHMVKIKNGETYSSLLKMYACFDLPIDQEGIASYYVKKYALEKHIKFQLLYDNTQLRSNMICGKKVWIGKLESNIVDF